jgi:hypothetical protein
MRNTADVTGGKPIAVLLQLISGISAINPLVAFYDIHGGKREVLFFYFDTTRDYYNDYIQLLSWVGFSLNGYLPNTLKAGIPRIFVGNISHALSLKG